MEHFNITYPSQTLAPYVKHYWTLNIDSIAHTTERVISTGCINLIFHKGNRMHSSSENKQQPQSFIGGLTTDYSDLTSTGMVNMIAVVFHPVGASAFFQTPPGAFRGNTISIDDIEDKDLMDLEKQILDEEDNKTCIGFIEQFLIRRLYIFKDYNYKRIQATIDTINKQPQIKISSLADAACLSYKQFNRIFTEYTGTNPKEFFRIIRFQRALHILQTNPQTSLAQLAFECGYYDQPHLIKEFKTFSGYTPTEYIATCTPYSDYFS